VTKHFPDLKPLAEQKMALIQDPQVLRSIVDALFDVKTAEGAKQLLS